MDKRPPLVYYAKNNDYIDFGEMTLYRFGGSPNIDRYYEVKIENPYGYGRVKLTEKDIRRLLSCLKEEFKDPPIVVVPAPFDYKDDWEDDEEYEMQGGDNLF